LKGERNQVSVFNGGTVDNREKERNLFSPSVVPWKWRNPKAVRFLPQTTKEMKRI
jgi:hypothetical protein